MSKKKPTDITRKQMVDALGGWRGRLLDMNRDSDSKDFWNEEENGDDSIYDAILAALEPVTEDWVEDRTAYIAEYPSVHRLIVVLEEAGVKILGKEGK